DGGGEKHRPVDLQHADENETHAVVPRRAGRGMDHGGVGAPGALGKLMQERLPLSARQLQIPKHILDQDNRGIDDDSEVDRADREQIRVLALQYQDDDAEEQGERNVDTDDDGAAQVSQEHPLDQEDQQTAEDQVVQDGMSRDVDERGAVVERNDLHPRRQ